MAEPLRDLAVRYTAAWCRHDAAGVAGSYSPQGSLSVNDTAPAIGREAIGGVAQAFMTAFPAPQVILDEVSSQGEGALHRWTLLGTNTGPARNRQRGACQQLRTMEIGQVGLIGESQGHFDEADYRRQLEQGSANRFSTT